MTAGYSGTSLAQKLGYTRGMKLFCCGMPESVMREIDPDSVGLDVLASPTAGIEAAHIFVTERAHMERKLSALRKLLQPSGFVWTSWPKKAAKMDTDITEDTIREVALPMGFVDVKVCAIDEIWSGLKLMVRKEHR
jgi:hypothetical protein